MDIKPDTIKIAAFQREEIFASHANLYVTVKGSSVVSGDQALKKAREVSQLVEALTGYGLSAEAVQLLGVHIETASGVLLKSSSATYSLRVHMEKLDQLAELLDILTSQKNTTLERIEWKYPEETAEERALEAAMAKAKAKAGKVAAALGVKLLGVYDFNESVFDEDRPVPFQKHANLMFRAVEAPEPSLDMDIQHSKTVQVNVEIWYRVSAF
jgi:uncharacterized protein YggE